MTSLPCVPPGPVHLRLRLATHQAHVRVERRLPFGSPLFNLPAYRQLIAALYGFYRPLEAALALRAGAIPDLQWPERVKLPLLTRDLGALGVVQADVEALPSCDWLPSVHNQARVLGCLYVLEGSTLGGQVVQRLLVDRFGAAVADALSFFSSYGSQVGTRWRSFLGCLEASGHDDSPDEAEKAAADTFRLLEIWLQQREVLT